MKNTIRKSLRGIVKKGLKIRSEGQISFNLCFIPLLNKNAQGYKGVRGRYERICRFDSVKVCKEELNWEVSLNFPRESASKEEAKEAVSIMQSLREAMEKALG